MQLNTNSHSLPKENSSMNANVNISKFTSGLFNNFKSNFNRISNDTDILRPVLSKESIEEINFGANVNVPDWNKITFNKKH